MEEFNKHGTVGVAAARSGMDRKTAAKYLEESKLPSELVKPRHWRTREDPFAEDWDELRARLEDAPELEAKALFEDLMRRSPGRHEPGELRTLQRRIRRWRALEGPPKEVFFSQLHRPGEAMQTDFTWATELGVTIDGEPLVHMLCHPVLPYSNWEWATVCYSESLLALRCGVQAALFRLGRVPEFHQTDNSTAATHDLPSGKRGFNEDYEALMRHLGMTPRTIAPGEKQQNGDVEALNGSLKRRLVQHLLLRGSRDFASVADYEQWLVNVLLQANELRQTKLRQELAVMKELAVKRLPEFDIEKPTVTSWSTIAVARNRYSVPSRLIGEKVEVRVYHDRLEVSFAGAPQAVIERLRGEGGHRIDYRHVIWSLVRKPGAFARYRYREDLFPSLPFRRAYDALRDSAVERRADIDYVRILHLAASTMECDVEAALTMLLDGGHTPTADAVKALVSPPTPSVPELVAPVVDLASYDELLVEEVGS
jgi:transposase InsO family protein